MIHSSQIRVAIREVASDAVAFEVINEGASPIWLVIDPWFVWSRRGSEITLSFARGLLRRGVVPFGYFHPEVEKLKPGGRWCRKIPLSWPLPLSSLWNPVDQAMPDPGEYKLRVEIGFGSTPHPPAPTGLSDVEQDTLRWQTKVESSPVTIRLP